MKKNLDNPTFPDFSKLVKVTDLIYYDGPLMSHYRSQQGEDYIFYWCDADEFYNKWFIIKVDESVIAALKANTLSLRDMICRPIDGFLYLTDIDDEINYHNTRKLSHEEIPDEYLPYPDVYLDYHSDDTEQLEELSLKFSSGILEFHLTGKEIESGSIPLSILAVILAKLEAIRKSMASDFIRNIQNDNVHGISMLDENTIRSCTQYDYMYSRTGSFSMILKSGNNYDQSEAAEICRDLFASDFTTLLTSASDKEIFELCLSKYNSALAKYTEMIKFMGNERLSMEINWCNAKTGTHSTKTIDSTKTSQMLDNISNVGVSTTEIIDITGRFYLINTKSQRFAFESIENGLTSTGIVEESLKDLIFEISFTRLYKIKLRRIFTVLGSKKNYSDTLISFELI